MKNHELFKLGCLVSAPSVSFESLTNPQMVFRIRFLKISSEHLCQQFLINDSIHQIKNEDFFSSKKETFLANLLLFLERMDQCR